MNYTALCNAVQDAVENTFTAEQLAWFCTQTEQKVFNTVQLPAARKNMTGTLTANNPYLTTPPGFLFVYSLDVTVAGQRQFLLDKDVNYMREAYPSPTSTGVPRFYAVFDGNTLIMAPTPDQTYTVEMHFGAYPESISTANTSWLGDNFDSVLLNGMLVEAARFLRFEQETVAQYDKMFTESLGLLKQLGDGKLRQDSYRSGQVRVPVR
jgi:hypothetical protein